MYKEFFGLEDIPFTLTPDPRFIVFTPSYNEVLASLYYGLENAKGLIVLTGEVGTGKTTALRWILRRLDSSVLAAYVFNPRLSIDEFYHHVTQMLGIRDWTNKAELLEELGRVLEERHRRGLRTVLIIDEAHELSDYVLEEIRLLMNFESDNAKHLQIVLTGQPELRESEEISAWRKLFGSLLALSYRQACAAVIKFIGERYGLESLAWLELRDNNLEKVLASGRLKNQPLNIGIPANDKRILNAARREIALELREKNKTGESQTIRLFPIAVGDEVRSALIVGDEIADKRTERYIAKFGHNVASELEILRLREELSRKVWIESGVKKFNDSLENIDSEEFLIELLQNLAELLNAERGSLLCYDEKSNSLEIKTAIGKNADKLKTIKENIGERAAMKVLQNARPLLAQNAEIVLNAPAPPERNYKTNSFIGFPVSIGKRKIGVLNFTDKTGKKTFDEFDLELLKLLSSQIAVAIDRAGLKHEAGELKQLSVTDALTGLLNRRYLEERLAEEIRRSSREGYVMSFLMIDVDEFKSYNDTFSHPEGDKALKLVAHSLKDTLRGADVAARYGGEEFSILLPQTSSEEAEIIAERIRKRVSETTFPNRQVTVSIGIASSSPELNSVESLISAADKALYEAKRRGRNNVQVYEKMEEE